ncbi:MFS-type transporter SLC18B1-like isoform X2 [Tachypleus tridentatus]|uniref:MFS-type transporter SLC18B1-like isoform X2 n=1 Tax=Tachypleus tridentatus TaxID=6853 RepID=UPI003FD2DF47
MADLEVIQEVTFKHVTPEDPVALTRESVTLDHLTAPGSDKDDYLSSQPCRHITTSFDSPSEQNTETVFIESEVFFEEKTVKGNDKPPEKTRRHKYILCCFTLGNLLVGACYSLLAPFFPQVAESKGASPSKYGMVFAVYELVGFVFSPIYGRLLPVLKPTFLMYASLFLCGGCSILFGFLHKSPPGTAFLALALAIRIVQGFGGCAFYTVSSATLITEFPEKATFIYATMEMMYGVGMIIGPTLGGGLYQLGGYALPFVVLGVGLLFISLLAFILVPEIEAVMTHTTGYRRLLLHPRMIICQLVVFSCFMIFGYNDATLEPHLRRFNLQPAVLGLVFVISGGVYALTTPIWGYLCDSGISSRFLCLTGASISFLSILLIGPAPFFSFEADLWLIIVALIFLELGLSAKMVCSFSAAIQDSVKRGFPNDLSTYGMICGIFASMASLGL